MVLAPDSLSKRVRVAEKLIAVGKYLRLQNNYAAAHTMMSGVRDALTQLDALGDRIATGCADWKPFLSNEKLFRSSGGFSSYRLALHHSTGPVILDM